MSGGDVEDVPVLTAPQGDAVVEVAVRGGAVADGAADEIQIDDLDLDVAQDVGLDEASIDALHGHRRRHGSLGQRGRLVADHHHVATRACVDVELAEDEVEVARQEVEAVGRARRRQRVGVEVGIRRDEDPVITVVEGDVGDRRRGALDVEHVGARAGVHVQLVDQVVVDAVHPRVQGRRPGQRRGIHRHEADADATHHLSQEALEVDVVGGTEPAHRDIVGERAADQPLQGVAHLVGRGVVGQRIRQ